MHCNAFLWEPHKTNELYLSCEASVLGGGEIVLRSTAIEEAVLRGTTVIAKTICLAGFSSREAFVLRGTTVLGKAQLD